MAKTIKNTQSGAANDNNTDPLSAKSLWAKVEACRRVKKSDLLRNWQDSVSYRRGKPFKSVPPEDTVNVNADWSRTKNKIGQLFYQVPEILLQARRPEWRPAAAVFASAVNFELAERMHAENMMAECLADLINACGIMICKVGYEGTFDDVATAQPPQEPLEGQAPQPPTPQLSPVSGADLGGQQDDQTGGAPPPPQDQPDFVSQGETGMVPQQQSGYQTTEVYSCYYARRISPLHFIWPVDFHGTNWQEAPYLGWEGYMPVAVAKRMGWVDDTVEGVQIEDENWLLFREWSELKPADRYVKFVELFIKPYFYDPAEKDPRHIKRIVLVEGGMKDSEKAKVVDEDFRWQKQDPQTGRWVGMTDFPLKVCTIAHISDMAIPPSDSEVGRPQVRELIRSRSQMLRQRDHSLALRWFDVNQVDPEVADRLRKGKWQDMIPMNGPGNQAIGEVARAAFPQENWEFEKIIRSDLDESWSMGANQQGMRQPGDQTATESSIMQNSNDVRLNYEQQWVERFFLEVAQATGQLMQMFCDKDEWTYIVGQQGEQVLQQWNKDVIQGDYLWKMKPDSQLRLDVGQARAQSLNLYKLLRKDSLINPQELISQVLELHGLDPTKMFAPPPPPPKDDPKMSYAFKGTDLANPMVVAIIQKSAAPLTAQDIAAAKQLISATGDQGEQQAVDQNGQPVPGPQGPPMPIGPAAPPPPNLAPHPGPPPVVQPMDRRYNEQTTTAPQGSRDSGMPGLKK